MESRGEPTTMQLKSLSGRHVVLILLRHSTQPFLDGQMGSCFISSIVWIGSAVYINNSY